MQANPTQDKLPAPIGAILLATIFAQLMLSYYFCIHTSFYIADDLNAIDAAYKTPFWDFIQLPIDVHRVPLHRATNYLIHHLLPMNFAAALLFLLSCHAASMLVLYRLLQRLNNSPLNAWLITAYALNAYVVIPMHWWSAGLHRFPYVLASVVSCYFFTRFYDTNRNRDGLLALLSAVIAAGFYIKAILIPLYWGGVLFCIMNLRDWRRPLRQYALIGIAGLCSLTYVAWYMQHNTDTVVKTHDLGIFVYTGMRAGFAVTGQMLLQMAIRTDLAQWIDMAWLAVLAIIAFSVRDAWRGIVAGLAVLSANLLMIAGSARSQAFGIFIMLVPRYYYELLFLLAIFGSLMCRNIHLPARLWQILGAKSSTRRYANAGLLLTILAAYTAVGWRSALIYVNPGPQENQWRCANYERNLLGDIDKIGVDRVNLVEGSLPDYFQFDKFTLKPLPLSMYLAWHGLHPHFSAKAGSGRNKPLFSVDQNGHLQPVAEVHAP